MEHQSVTELKATRMGWRLPQLNTNRLLLWLICKPREHKAKKPKQVWSSEKQEEVESHEAISFLGSLAHDVPRFAGHPHAANDFPTRGNCP